MGSKPSSSTVRLIAIILALLATISPLFMDRRSATKPEPEEQSWSLAAWLPLLLVMVVVGINMSNFMEGRFMRFDPYWIHRVGGSSCGIAAVLFILAFILKCKASLSG